jgi:hypothetical protein
MQEQPRRSRLVERAALLAFVFAASVVSAVASCSPAPSPPPENSPDASSDAGSDAEGEAGLGDASTPDDSGTEAGHPSSTDRSRRGTACSVKNDCESGFSCIRGLCQPLSFELTPTGKECFQIDCVDRDDCCGNLETEVPEKCKSRAAKCLPKLPGCVVKECTRSSDCGGGGVCNGQCVVSAGQCTSTVDCLTNRCVEGNCTLDFVACDSDAECVANTCTGGSCDCSNPSYDLADPVCTDTDCDGLCLWTCENSRCVFPTDCEADSDCFGSTPLCVDGACSECGADVDCSFDKRCHAGRCETPCTNDLHCPLFEACQAGECIYVGCRSDRECSLIPDLESLGFSPGLDRRLLRCNTDEEGVGECLIPCQTDAQCPSTEVCSGGRCQYIGCETASECKTIIGVHDQVASDDQPWVPSVECR